MSIIIQETKDLKLFKLSKEIKEKQFLMHTQEWQKFIESSFNKNKSSNIMNQTFIVAINKDQDEIKTLLPITKIKSPIFKKRIISSAYQEYGGFIGKQEHQEAILNHIKNQYQKTHEFLEIRGAIDKENNPESLTQTSSKQNKGTIKLFKTFPYKRMYLNIADTDSTWKNIQKSKRKAIKKALKNLKTRELTIDDLNDFYKLYTNNMKLFGTPPYSKEYFKQFFEKFQTTGKGKVFGTFKEESKETKPKLASALLGFISNKKVHITTAVAYKKYASDRPGDLAHWEFIKWASQNNINHFDFGLVRENSGHYVYKKKWGCIEDDFPSFFLPLNQNMKQGPENPNPDKGILPLAQKVWRYIPNFITTPIGTHIRKQLGW